jgi:hypothetical protein
MNKGKITFWLRQLGLMHGVDKLKYYSVKIKNFRTNRQFIK